MTDLTRRSALALAAAAALVPALARAQEREPVVWDLTELYPTLAAWEAEKNAIVAPCRGSRPTRASSARAPPRCARPCRRFRT
ncbi:hypothetical protein [Phenylobacterium sp.]|uniref:hypothetical protein n=1 Tax=Phenylobacterium sp. TaxID=1871053 RepID=UPI002E3805FD|nr:hypothetical protein [Phenylobacterium sp.]HEX2561411.1 hypothetical protein [Phenylobacterium sp.]